jgi:hypothetical protein
MSFNIQKTERKRVIIVGGRFAGLKLAKRVELDRDVHGGTLALFDLNGKVVARQDITGRQTAVNTQSFGKGMYILKLIEGGMASEGVKIVKQ